MFFRGPASKQLYLTLVLAILLVLLAFPLTRNWRQKRAIDQEIKSLESQAATLEGKNSTLKNVLDYMQSSQFVEEEARTKLNYKKAGESVVVIEGEEGTVTSPTSPFALPAEPPTVTQSKARLNVTTWLDYFFRPKE